MCTEQVPGVRSESISQYVEAHDSGDVSLAVEATEQIQMATAYTPGRQFREIICRIEDIAPGTGLTLVSDSNTVMQRLAVVKDRKTGRLLLSSQNPYQKDSEIDHDFNSRFSPVIEDGQWLRIVPGFQSIAVYTSRDAIHWGRAMHHPFPLGHACLSFLRCASCTLQPGHRRSG